MTDNYKPADQDNRHRIATSLNETLFVEAGAGTGKTTALVARIVSLVKAGNEISRIAAITFTEAAAAELRDRVRRELENAASGEENALCQKAAADIDNAAIQTLHSFAGSILREQPLEAGLPPGFEVIEEIEAEIQFEERWHKCLDEAMDSPTTGGFLIKSLRLGLSLDKLKAVASAFHENYDILPASFPLEPEPERKFSTEFVATVSELAGLLRHARNGEEDPLALHCLGLVERARRMGSAGAESDEGLVILSKAGKISFTGGKQSDWDSDPQTRLNACKMIKDSLKELQGAVLAGLEQTRRAALLPLLESLRQFALDYAGERRREGRVQFQDLLIWTRDLLKDNLKVRRYFQSKFSHILIDEFQDTDPIQAEIAFFLAEKAGSSEKLETEWLNIMLETGKLFVVGDPKQSIYRFRRADIITVAAVKELIIAGAANTAVPLVQNFRSQSSILEWVNTVFQECMIDDGSGIQTCYLPLEARWKPQDTLPPL